MNEQSKVTRRHVLMGGAALAALALVPAAIDDAPRAEAIPPRRRKYFYSANPISNKHRYGWLELPHLTHSSMPVAVLIHGGAWETGGPASMKYIAEYLCDHGVACWNIEYRALDSGGGWPTTYADVCDAIDHLIVLKLSAAPMLDLDRVYLVGHSAGGQLAALALGQSPSKLDTRGLLIDAPLSRLAHKSLQLVNLRGDRALPSQSSNGISGGHASSGDSLRHLFTTLSTGGHPDADEISEATSEATQETAALVGTGDAAGYPATAPEGPRIPIRGFASLNGVLDVVDSANHSKFSNIRTFLGGSPRDVPGNYAAANPIRHLPSNKDMLLAQGTCDYVIPHGQVRRYGRTATRRGNRVTYLTLKDARHNDVLLPWRNPDTYDAVTEALGEFIGAKKVSSKAAKRASRNSSGSGRMG